MAYDRAKSDAQFSYLAIWESLRQINYFAPKVARKELSGMELCDIKPEYACGEKLLELASALTEEVRAEFTRIFNEDIAAVYEEKERQRAKMLEMPIRD